MKKATWLSIVATLVVVAAVIGLVAHGLSTGMPVEVAIVSLGPIHECIDERGKTRLPETLLITMPFDGRIESIGLVEGDPVEAGQVVAKIVPLDLDLSVDEATAVVQRLEAALRRNADLSIEKTTLEQANQFVKSMTDTVKSAAARVDSGRAKHVYALKSLARVEELSSDRTLTQDDLDRAQLLEVETSVELEQDRLVVVGGEHQGLRHPRGAHGLQPVVVGANAPSLLVGRRRRHQVGEGQLEALGRCEAVRHVDHEGVVGPLELGLDSHLSGHLRHRDAGGEGQEAKRVERGAKEDREVEPSRR